MLNFLFKAQDFGQLWIRLVTLLILFIVFIGGPIASLVLEIIWQMVVGS